MVVVPLPGCQWNVKVKLGILTVSGRGDTPYWYKMLLHPCSSERFGSSYWIFPGFSNTPRPPHGRDNCSFSSWCLGNPHLWNIQLLVVPELFCMVGAKGIYSIKSIICHLKNPEIIRSFSVQSAFWDNISHLTSLLVWQADSVPIPAPSEWAGGSLIA